MPKTSPYPTCSIQKTLPIVELLAENNNTLAVKDAAGLLGQSQSGHFMNIISSAVKYQLLKHKKGILSLTTLGAKLLNSKNMIDQTSLREALSKPKGFEALIKIWEKKQEIKLDIIEQYLELSNSDSQKIKSVLEESFLLLTTAYSNKTIKKVSSKTKKNTLNIQINGEDFKLEQSINNKTQLEAFINLLKANFN